MSNDTPRLGRTKKTIEPATQTIPLEWARVPLTKNQQRQMFYRQEAEIKKTVAEDVLTAVRRTGTKPVDRALIRLVYRPGTKRLCDPDGLGPTLSFCLDGLVAAGILPDDNLLHVFEASTRIWPPMPGLPAAFWLEIEEIAEADDVA